MAFNLQSRPAKLLNFLHREASFSELRHLDLHYDDFFSYTKLVWGLPTNVDISLSLWEAGKNPKDEKAVALVEYFSLHNLSARDLIQF